MTNVPHSLTIFDIKYLRLLYIFEYEYANYFRFSKVIIKLYTLMECLTTLLYQP